MLDFRFISTSDIDWVFSFIFLFQNQFTNKIFNRLTFITLPANSADDKIDNFPQEIGFDIPCKLSSKETISMKYQSLFSEEK